MKVNIIYRKNFSVADIEKHNTSMDMLELAVNSVEFKHRLIGLSLEDYKTSESKLALYNKIMEGAEKLDPTIDHEMDIAVEMYKDNSKVVGWTKPSIKQTYLNRKFFDAYNYAQIAGNCFHEWLHKMGYGHSSASDHDSVPYAVGYLIRDLVQMMINGIKLTPIEYEGTGYNQGQFQLPETAYKNVTVCYKGWRTLWRKKCTVERVKIG